MKKVFIWLLILCSLALFLFCGYKIYDIWQTSHAIDSANAKLSETAENSKENPDAFMIDWNAVKQENPAVVAWLIVPGCGISTPVVHTDNNTFYLDHDVNGQYNYLGAIFLDASNNPDFTSNSNSIIYGHSTDNGTMFTSLANFKDEKFFDSHNFVYLLTEKQNYKCPIFAFSEVPAESDAFTLDPGSFGQQVKEGIAKNAIFSRSLSGAFYPLLSLSTCNLDFGYYSDQRLVLTCLLQKTNEPIPKPTE